MTKLWGGSSAEGWSRRWIPRNSRLQLPQLSGNGGDEWSEIQPRWCFVGESLVVFTLGKTCCIGGPPTTSSVRHLVVK